MLSLGLGLTAARPLAGGAAIYADSVSGNDANDGLTVDTPVQTLAEALSKAAAAATTRFRLKRGSHWREDFDLSALTGATAEEYGALGDPPLIDGSDVVATWTLSAGNVWQASVAHFVGTSDYGRVYEDGEVLSRVADESTCNATPGSYVALLDASASPWTVKIHPSDSGNPNTNGKEYEVTVRKQAVQATGGGGATIRGIWTTKSISNNGSTEVGLGGTMDRLMMTDGTKHNALIGSGTVRDTLMQGKQVIEGSDYIVAFTPSGPGNTTTFRRVGVDDRGNNSQVGVNYSHDLGAGPYASATLEQCWAVGAYDGWSLQFADAATAEGVYAKDCVGHGGVVSCAVADIQRMLVNRPASGQVGISLGYAGAVTIRNCAFYLGLSYDNILRASSGFNGGSIIFEHCVIMFDDDPQSSGGLIGSEGWTSGTIQINNCIMIGFPYGATYAFGFGPTFSSQNNVWGGRLDGAGVSFLHTVDGWKTLSQMQALGLETNSIQLDLTGGGMPWTDLFLGDPSAGDFRLNPATAAGAAAIALGAGPQSHWDWNLRQIASGPPTAWPMLPLSAEDRKTYILAPGSWGFYAYRTSAYGDDMQAAWDAAAADTRGAVTVINDSVTNASWTVTDDMDGKTVTLKTENGKTNDTLSFDATMAAMTALTLVYDDAGAIPDIESTNNAAHTNGIATLTLRGAGTGAATAGTVDFRRSGSDLAPWCGNVVLDNYGPATLYAQATSSTAHGTVGASGTDANGATGIPDALDGDAGHPDGHGGGAGDSGGTSPLGGSTGTNGADGTADCANITLTNGAHAGVVHCYSAGGANGGDGGTGGGASGGDGGAGGDAYDDGLGTPADGGGGGLGGSGGTASNGGDGGNGGACATSSKTVIVGAGCIIDELFAICTPGNKGLGGNGGDASGGHGGAGGSGVNGGSDGSDQSETQGGSGMNGNGGSHGADGANLPSVPGISGPGTITVLHDS